MRIRIEFESERGSIELPIHYNHLVQALIYRNIDPKVSKFIHEKGYELGKRRFKLFTFSRLYGKSFKKISKDKFKFETPLKLWIASPKNEILESLAEQLIKKSLVNIGGNKLFFSAIQVEMPKKYKEEMTIKTLSPIVIYSTLIKKDGKKKTYYYNPWEKEFSELIEKNLIKKYVILNNKNKPRYKHYFLIEPLKVSKKDEVIVKFKGTIIKGWKGLYKIRISKDLFYIAMDAGLGSKNSQGFGMIDEFKLI